MCCINFRPSYLGHVNATQGTKNMYDITMTRSLWFSSRGTDALSHTVARELIQKATLGDWQNYEVLLWIVRRYE